MKTIVFYAMVLSISTISIEASEAMSRKFEQHRYRAIELIEQDHQDCILTKLIPTIRDMEFRFKRTSREYRAWIEDGHVWINPDASRWKEKESIVTIIHEAFHLTLINEKPICGADCIRQPLPVCSPFGRDVYVSWELSEEIRRHVWGRGL